MLYQFDTAGQSASSALLRVDQYFDFIITNAGNAASHKDLIQKGRSMFKGISGIVGSSVLIASQTSFLMNFL